MKEQHTKVNKQAFEKWFRERFGGLANWEYLVDFIWHYFVPHLKGEFPREVMRLIVRSLILDSAGGHDVDEAQITPYLEEFERLWNGDHIVDANKKVCSTCGGIGESCKSRRAKACEEWKNRSICCTSAGCCGFIAQPCPDCTEKPPKADFIRHSLGGARVYGDQRKTEKPQRMPIRSCLKCHIIFELSSEGTIKQRLCTHRFVDQRKGREHVCIFVWPDKAESGFQGFILNSKNYPDRRNG